jgi:hypothetical protein
MSEEIKDVKEEVIAPTTVVSTDTAKAEETKENIFEDENKRTIPYARFKEMVDTKKDLEKKVKQMEQMVNDKVNETARQYQTYYEGELAKINRAIQADPYAAQPEENNVYNKDIGSLNEQLTSLKSTIESLRIESETNKLNTQIGKLKDVYPMLDEEHVYAVKKLKPDWSLEECAEYSHQKWDGKIKEKVNRIMEQKKEAAKKPVLVAGEKFVLKPEEKPKSLKDAKKKYMDFMKLRNNE